jgi:hypothetical protein
MGMQAAFAPEEKPGWAGFFVSCGAAIGGIEFTP